MRLSWSHVSIVTIFVRRNGQPAEIKRLRSKGTLDPLAGVYLSQRESLRGR